MNETAVDFPRDADSTADPAISVAFALGWEAGTLFRGGSFESGQVEANGDDALPGLAGLSARRSTALAGDLIVVCLGKLEDRFAASARVDPQLVKDLCAAVEADPEDRKRVREAVRELHLDVLGKLTAAELRLGRAYGLGHALADTCLLPRDPKSFELAFGARLVPVKDWLSDLASSFPPHASRAVVLSLRAWESWVAEPHIDDELLDWPTQGAGVQEALHRQGELWRDLLAGDKHGEDMLDTAHYVGAANSLVRTMTSTLWHFLRPLRLPLLAAVPLLFAGIALFVFSDTVGKAFGVFVSVAATVGITGAGLRARLGKVATQLQTRLWGAELDRAIAKAVLIGPTGWDAKVDGIEVPPTGTEPKVAENTAVIGALRDAIRAGRREQVCELLAADVTFEDGAGLDNPDTVSEWLLQADNVERIAPKPARIEAVGTGALITHRKDRAEVWRIQEGKVRRWASYADAGQARKAARQNGAGGF